MTRPLATQITSFVLAALMTLGMLGSIEGFAKVETRQGAIRALMAQAPQPTNALMAQAPQPTAQG